MTIFIIEDVLESLDNCRVSLGAVTATRLDGPGLAAPERDVLRAPLDLPLGKDVAYGEHFASLKSLLQFTLRCTIHQIVHHYSSPICIIVTSNDHCYFLIIVWFLRNQTQFLSFYLFSLQLQTCFIGWHFSLKFY